MKQDRILKIGMVFIFLVLTLSFASSAMRSTPAYVQYMSDRTEEFGGATCEQGQDFIIQIAPFGCTPAVVRTDLLEEQNVPVFCRLGATKINPLVDVEAIESISFSGEYPPEVEGIAFHPAQAALGVKGALNNPILNNIGYVVIVLKKQANASAMPDFVSGNLTARIRYDVKNAFGIGRANFYLPELEDSDWEKKKYQYGFWNNKGYLKADDVGQDSAVISIYSGDDKLQSVSLDKGETSGEIYLPGFDCLASLRLKLNSLEASDSRALIKVNANIYEVAKNEKFLDNKCEVIRLEKKGLVQEIRIKCNEDEGVERMDFTISPKVNLSIGGVEKEVGLGDHIYKTADGLRSVYVGYIGTKNDAKDVNGLFVFLVSMSEHMDRLTEGDLNYYNIVVGELLYNDFKGGLVSVAADGVKGIAGVLDIVAKSVKDNEFYNMINYRKEEIVRHSFIDVSGEKAILNGFTEPIDSIVIEGISEYQDAVDDYETVIDSFSGESHVDLNDRTFGEEALYKKIVLAWDGEQKRTVLELCDEFKFLYPNSEKNIEEYCDNEYLLSNQEIATNYVTINGETKKIVFDGIYEPSFEDYGAEILVQDSEGTDSYEARKNKLIYINDKTDTIQLISLEQDSAKIEINAGRKEKTLILGKDVSKSYGGYTFTLSDVNLKKTAKVSVIPGIEDSGTEASFGFRVDIEKRAFKLPPEKIKERIENLDSQIGKWQNFSEGVGKTVEVLQKACVVTGAGLVFKNFMANAGGTGIARGHIMRGSGGWYEKCTDISSETGVSIDKCLLDNADTIDNDVTKLSELIVEQNKQMKELEKGITETDLFGTSTVNTDEFMKKYSTQVINYWDDSFPDSFADPDGNEEAITKDDMLTILNYSGWKNRYYSQEQLREIELWAKVLKDDSASSEAQSLAERELYSILFDVRENAGDYVERSNIAGDFNINAKDIGLYETKDTKRIAYKGLTYEDIKEKTKIMKYSVLDSSVELEPDTPVQLMQYQGEIYIIVLDDSFGENIPIKRLERYSGLSPASLTLVPTDELMIYDSDGNLVENPGKYVSGLKDIYFQKYDSSSYENEYKNAELRYYETEPYKGRPAIVPFDLKHGWYAATKQTLPVGGNIRAFDDSGAVSSFWLCNVGENGLEEGIGVDDCGMVNRRTGPFDQFEGLDEDDAEDLVNDAFRAIEQASRAYGSGLSGNVKILGETVSVGAPAVDIPGMECQDFMSPKDCNLLFNVCDPVICPSSRCDLGGAYPVRDVVQSGIIGSLVLCLPNMQEGIAMPVCLTGVKAGIDGWLSVKTSYRDCLQNSLDTGEMIGICDEIHSIYICEFFWRQALPLVDLAIPSLIGRLFGQGSRGGGEYLTVADAWADAKGSVNYFTQYYGANSFKAFKSRSTEEVGGELCKLSVSGVYPKGADLLDTLSEPDSPAQFHGRFDEIPFSSVTVPPTSHYKVFYHIFAGKNSGSYYQVYLKGIPGSSYYQDTSSTLMIASGYVGVGEYATETRDLTEASGYQQLCINVNGQEECGFKEVSTSFVVDYVSDLYVASQVTDADIKTETECISGMIFDDANYGIIRTCATGNPGIGSDSYAGTESSRWKQVGYCDSENIGCWLDTENIRDIIEGVEIEGNVLEEVAEDYLDLLRNEGNYISEAEFNSKVEEISNEGDSFKQLVLIEEIFDKVFLNKEKAYMFLLRGNAYADIARRSIKEEMEKLKTAGEGEEEEDKEGEEEDKIEEFDFPIFEYKDGNVLVSNLHYAYSAGWYWSPDEENWMKVSTIVVSGGRYDEDEPTKDNGELIQKLDGKSYAQGLEILIDTVVRESEEGGFGKFNGKLYADNAEMNSKKEFTFRYRKTELPTTLFYFRFQNNKWEWSPDKVDWITVPRIIASGNFHGEPIKLIESLEGKDFYEGAQILFSLETGEEEVEEKEEEEYISLGETVVVHYSASRGNDNDLPAAELIKEALEEKGYDVTLVITDEPTGSRSGEWEDVQGYDKIIVIGGSWPNKLNYDYCNDYGKGFCSGREGGEIIFIHPGEIKGVPTYFIAGYRDTGEDTLASVEDFIENHVEEEFPTSESGSSSSSDSASPTGKRIWEIAKNYADEGYNEYRINEKGRKEKSNVCSRFVTRVLIGAGISTPGLELEDTACALDAIDNLIVLFDGTTDFVEVDASKLEKGDVVVFGQNCEKTQHTAIFSHYNTDRTRVYAYGDPYERSKVKLENYEIMLDEWYVYRAFRYAPEGTSDEIEEREKWIVDFAIKETNILLQIEGRRSGGKYSENMVFINELLFDGILTKEECRDFRGLGQVFGANNMKWLKELLKKKII